MLIHALQRDSIDLDGKAGGLGGENAIQSLFNFAPARDSGESIRIQSIKRDIDAPDTGREKLIRIAHQLRAIGGQRQFAQATRPDALA